MDNLIAGLTIVLWIVMAIVFVIALVWAITNSLKIGQLYRAHIAQRLESLRLSRMLGALGVDSNKYLHSERLVDVQAQMRRCEECADTVTCDERLEQDDISIDTIAFCNNEATLADVKARQA